MLCCNKIYVGPFSWSMFIQLYFFVFFGVQFVICCGFWIFNYFFCNFIVIMSFIQERIVNHKAVPKSWHGSRIVLLQWRQNILHGPYFPIPIAKWRTPHICWDRVCRYKMHQHSSHDVDGVYYGGRGVVGDIGSFYWKDSGSLLCLIL